jgi:hypothetical protein
VTRRRGASRWVSRVAHDGVAHGPEAARWRLSGRGVQPDSRQSPAASRGLRIARAGTAGLSDESHVVFYSLTDDVAVRDVVLGAEGLLAGARRGSILVDLSTVLPATSQTVCRVQAIATMGCPASGRCRDAHRCARGRVPSPLRRLGSRPGRRDRTLMANARLARRHSFSSARWAAPP